MSDIQPEEGVARKEFTVGQLIERLSKFPGDWGVYVDVLGADGVEAELADEFAVFANGPDVQIDIKLKEFRLQEARQ